MLPAVLIFFVLALNSYDLLGDVLLYALSVRALHVSRRRGRHLMGGLRACVRE